MSDDPQLVENIQGLNAGGQQFLSFLLNGEEYGIDILKVQELRGWTPVTKVPDMPEYLKGVLNLRGAIIPIVDLRQRFGLDAQEYGPTTVVIVVKVVSGSTERIMGIIVDAVAETYNLDPDDIQPPPQMGGVMNSEYITGLVAQGDKMVVLMDVDELMNSGELAVEQPESGDA